MSRFKDIDIKLTNLSERLNGKLSKDRPEQPRDLINFEERRIDWMDSGINKAIIIQPNFEDKGVNSTIWNFINIAWFDDSTSVKRPQWIKILVDKGKFETIQNSIDSLLQDSEENLRRISLQDLK